MQKLVLGTANFGDNYGISNKLRLSTQEVEEILNWASGKIEELDTSEDYKGSHKAISKHSKNFKITTKVNLNQLGSIKDLVPKVINICKEIGIEKIERVLLRPHTADPNFTLDAIKELEKLRLIGSIASLGLTIYETKEMDYFIRVLDFPITFQIPLNLLNRSFQERITSNPIRYQGFNFYVRSIFLQGLLLMNPEEIPLHLTEVSEPIRYLKDKLTKLGLSTLEATFAFIKDQNWATGTLVGVTSLDELKANLHAFEGKKEIDWCFLQDLPHPPARILDPRLW
jgi:aryl-alcohol dehydrogenase-like predicted oxidoreductase